MSSPPDPVFFTDRDLGKQFPAALRAHGLVVETHDDHFGQQTPDEVWLAAVAKRNWIVLTRDKRIRYSPVALSAALGAEARVLILVAKNLTHARLAEVFIDSLPRVRRLLGGQQEAFVGKIRRDAVDVWVTKTQWERSVSR